MAFSAIRKLPLAVALMLGCATIGFPAQAGWFDSDPKPAAKKEEKAPTQEPATNLEDSIRQAQMLRLAGQYPDAIKHLSQLMMVAADDVRIIGEYGKTLAAMGRASDAVQFLTRAQQMQPRDWTVYSALGVALDQLGNQKEAQVAYEQALTIKPEEPSVLNNFALSRMLAKDPEMARALMTRAEAAGGRSDAKIARNITMIRSLAAEMPVASSAPARAPVAQVQKQVVPQIAPPPVERVVMQRVPADPLAGPVQPVAKPKPANATPTATHAPRPLQQAAPVTKTETAVVAPAAKPVASSPAPSQPVKTAETAPGPVKAAEPAKFTPALRTANTKPEPVKAAEAVKQPAVAPTTPAMAVAEKPVPAVVVRTPAKTTDAKPASAKTAEADKPLPAVPGLRMTANAY
ncbi:MAG TPA: tetratricopeptide repeat protein [Rhizomicrobium sp.]|nr:tetratricopeptide repeat protein [Rhizomicrobium sp.]